MKTFQINKNIRIMAEVYEAPSNWGHKAYLYISGRQVDQEKITYFNRTWESFEFESILEKLSESESLSDYQKRIVKKYIKNGARVEDDLKPLKTIASIASLGDIFGQTKKQKNDWKARMLKAGLENKGLIMPDDWDELSEQEKEKRLNGVIKQLGT